MSLHKVRTIAMGVIGAVVIFVFAPLLGASASTSLSYDFDNVGDLAANFDAYVPAGNVAQQSATGGLNNSGAIAAAQNTNTSAVFASKATYSLGPVGSVYTFSSYMQSIGGNGYSGMGFTSLVPSASNASGVPFRPTDALGISVHGGGFVFHNGATDFNGNFDGSGLDPAITTVIASNYLPIIGNPGNAPDNWYKIILTINRDTATTFDMQVQVWPSNADGTLRTQSALAVFELNNQTQPTLLAAPAISTYINFSGDRVYFFDNYQVSLSGGSSVIQAGAPVVLTSSATDANNAVTVAGDVTATGGASVSERGFVYSTSASPTVSDSKIIVGQGLGTFSGVTPSLPNGTYYFRAYAINSTGITYGSEEVLTLTSALPSVISGSNTPVTALASTGVNSVAITSMGLVALAAVVLGFVLIRSRRRSE